MRTTSPAVLGPLLAAALLGAATSPARAADTPLDRAADLARAGRCKEALPILDGVAAGDPSAEAAQYLRARCFEELGRGAEAAAIYEALAKRHPESAPAALELRARATAARAGAGAPSTRPSGGGAGAAGGSAVDPEVPYRRPPPAAEREGYHPATIAGYLSAAGGGVLVAAGALFAALARGHEKEIEDLALNGSRDPLSPGEPLVWDDSLARIEREGRLFARLSVGLVAVGGAALVTGILVGILGVPREPAPEESGVDVGVEPVPAGAGVRLRLRF